MVGTALAQTEPLVVGEVFVFAKNVFDEDAVTLWNLPQSRWMRDARNVGVGFQAHF